jgi:hypothetical protein
MILGNGDLHSLLFIRENRGENTLELLQSSHPMNENHPHVDETMKVLATLEKLFLSTLSKEKQLGYLNLWTVWFFMTATLLVIIFHRLQLQREKILILKTQKSGLAKESHISNALIPEGEDASLINS